MVRTIQVSSCLSVQGPVLHHLPDGRVAIRVDGRTYEGVPIAQPPRALPEARPAA